MLSSSAIEPELHKATQHSVLSVQLDPNYVDARTQPVSCKTYPHFFRRFPLDPQNPLHQFLRLTSAITYHKQYRDSTHLLRVQPSAGALYPTELYVQLRGISGMLDGIYHLEPQTNSLTLIYELIDDGIEGYFSDARSIQGCILLLSCVYFRSSWKYKNRSLRYCFLDSGHHLGAIEAAAYAVQPMAETPYQFLFDFDQPALNDDFGFESQEFVTVAAVFGTPKERPVRRLRSPLPIVAGTDYFEPNRFIEAGYQKTLSSNLSPTADQTVLPLSPPIFPIAPSQWLQAIQQRRSARRFFPHPIDRDDFLTLGQTLAQPIASASRESLEIYAVVHRVSGLPSGLYRYPDQSDGGTCLKAGEFHLQTGHLCINQAIARDCAVVFFIVADYENYRIALHQAGLLGQRLYLAATALNLGCSGIGAFYDLETQVFLETDHPVLYAIAIGQPSDTKSSNECNKSWRTAPQPPNLGVPLA